MRHLVVLALVLGVAGWAAAVGSAQGVTTCAPNGGVTVTQGITQANGTATVGFTVAEGCSNVQLSLVSYKAPGSSFDEQSASQQVMFDSATDTYSAGSYSLSVDVPSCYYQVDFVYGTPIEHLGPAGTDNFYGKQGRLIVALNGGTTACTAENGGGTPETHVTICHATGTPDNAGNGYVLISPSAEGVYSGHLSQHDADIIPPFTYNGQTYSQHWDAAGQAIYNNGCNAVQTSTGGTQNPSDNQSTPPAPVPLPSITLVKLERVGDTGAYITGPVTAKVGDTIEYQLVVTDTGTTDVSVNLVDAGCDSLSLTGPQALTAGASLTYTCSHVLTTADGASYTNTAVASANNAGPVQASVQSTVTATVGTTTTAQNVAPVTRTVKPAKHKVVHKTLVHKKVKKVTKKAKPAHAVIAAAHVTG